jgi:signal transduction histidine kinase
MISTIKTATLLTDLVARLASAKSLPEVTGIVASTARALVGADGTTFVLRDGDRCYYADEDAISPLWKGQRFAMEACVSGWAMVHRQTVQIPDIYSDARVPVDAYRPTFVKSMCMVPIRVQDPLGAIGVYWAQSYTPTEEQVRVIQILAESAAGALENLALREIIAKQDHHALEAATHSLVHDLRTPLSTVRLFADMLKAEGGGKGGMDQRTSDKCLSSIIQGCDRMNLLLERMLGLYRATANTLRSEVIQLSDMVAELSEDFQRKLPERKIELRVQPKLVAFGDPLLVRLVLENLVGNAIKYSSKQPTSVVSFGKYSEDQQMTTFYVRDNGAGFKPEKAPLLFRPLVRLHDERDYPGIGLGLASVARIVESHGGAVRAESEGPGGATFYFSLPLPPAS